MFSDDTKKLQQITAFFVLTVCFYGLSSSIARGAIDATTVGCTPCYLPTPDLVLLPNRSAFENSDFYYATGFHEICHWTGHATRLNRVFGTRFGDLGYAFEELVAEIGAAFLGAQTGIPFENMRHPEYIHHWLQILKGDSKAIFTAAAKAQHAADFVLDQAGIVRAEEETLPAAA